MLLVLDGSRPLEKEDYDLLEKTQDRKRIVLLNKNDLPLAFDPTKIGLDPVVSISAKEKKMDALEKALESYFDTDSLVWKPRLSNERQIGLLEQARADLLRAQSAMEAGIEPDLIEIDIESSHNHLKEILGEVHREDLLDTLFSNYCLGK